MSGPYVIRASELPGYKILNDPISKRTQYPTRIFILMPWLATGNKTHWGIELLEVLKKHF